MMHHIKPRTSPTNASALTLSQARVYESAKLTWGKKEMLNQEDTVAPLKQQSMISALQDRIASMNNLFRLWSLKNFVFL